MNQTPMIQPSWAVVVLIVLPLLGFIGIKVFRRFVRHWRVRTNPLTTTGGRTSTLREIARCWLAPTGVMAVFVALSGVFGHEFERWFSLTSVAVIPATVEPSESPVQTDNLSNKLNTENKLPIPSWIDDGKTQIDGGQKIVLRSGLWATEAEASRELLLRAASIVRTDFAERHKNWFDRPGHRFLSDEQLAYIAVKRQYLEPVIKKTGAMELPMYRLHQQIEISPAVRDEIYPAWKSAVLGYRVVIIGTVLSLMTLVANAASLFVKLKRLPKNHGTIYAASVATCSATAWIVGDVVLAMQLCL